MSYPPQPPSGYDHRQPPRNDLSIILLLAIGLPILVLSGGGAVFFVLTAETAKVTVQGGGDSLVTETAANPPEIQLDVGAPPSATSAP
ncbi:hypothetical protein [Nonomuraea zeae]|uniref:Uncharacterized protein n=1 Tax=Nonomuraea zeae TaxID=1642303 RepID=A0A5S4G6L9_9ACTN|nr:hypothetical protein [Nonomuraea zeae]TMR28666.1 hypothetical protein ETD85_35010 [Nonomuraea zeae]